MDLSKTVVETAPLTSILIVDDDSEDVLFIRRAFRKNNVQNPLHTVGSGEEALDFLQRALHVTRISQGLYSEPQIAIVERLIDCHVAIEDWDAVDDNFRYLHLLYTRLYDKGSEQWNHGLAQISDWHIIALNNNLGSNMTEHLREANRLFRQRLSLAEGADNVDENTLNILRHNVDTTAMHLRRKQQEEEGGLYTERAYSRMDMQNRDRESSIASLD